MSIMEIDKLTNAEIDYAVAKAQGWSVSFEMATFSSGYYVDENEIPVKIKGFGLLSPLNYHPTINQNHCGDLIDAFGISTEKNGLWSAYVGNPQQRIGFNLDKSRLVAACRAFLWSKREKND